MPRTTRRSRRTEEAEERSMDTPPAPVAEDNEELSAATEIMESSEVEDPMLLDVTKPVEEELMIPAMGEPEEVIPPEHPESVVEDLPKQPDVAVVEEQEEVLESEKASLDDTSVAVISEKESSENAELEKARADALKGLEEEEDAVSDKKRKVEAEELEAKLRAEEERLKREATLEKFWAPIHADPDDFPAWTKLLQYVESHEHSMAEKVYNKFLDKYPFCFGYWKKFADFQRIRVSPEAALDVFVRGVKAIPLSVDLWIHYLNFVELAFGERDSRRILDLCEKALQEAGLEFRSNKLWDLCIRLAEKHGDLKLVWSFYCRLMHVPTLQWRSAMDNCLTFVSSNNPREYFQGGEYSSLLSRATTSVLKRAKEMEPRDEQVEPSGNGVVEPDLPPGCDNLPEEEKAELLLSEKEKRGAMDELIHADIEACFIQVENEVQKRFAFESALKRPYFHVKPLEKAQLKNWRDYLDFEIEQGDPVRIRILFERCLIACAYYEEFWRKYADYMIQHCSGEQETAVRHIYSRACNVHLQKKLHVHFEFAAFEEACGHPDAADKILLQLEEKRGIQLLVALRRIQLVRRTQVNDHAKALDLFSSYWKHFKGLNEKGETECLGLKYARFLLHVAHQPDGAVEILKELKDLIDGSNATSVTRLAMTTIDAYVHMWPRAEAEALKVFEEAMSNTSLSAKDRLMFSQRRIEYLEDFGKKIETLQRACAEHAQNVKELTQSVSEESEQRKRGQVEESSAQSSAAKKARYAQSGQQQYQYYNQNYYPHAQWGVGNYAAAGYTGSYTGTGYAPAAAYGSYYQAGSY